jgi:hypothetical protein
MTNKYKKVWKVVSRKPLFMKQTGSKSTFDVKTFLGPKSTFDVKTFLWKTLEYSYPETSDEPDPRYMRVPMTFS